MPVRNPDWYDLNEGRAYPLADTATAISIGSDRLPAHIITDLNIRFPKSMGRYAFLGAVSVTENLVTVTIQAASSPVATGNFNPLAVVTVPRPIDQGRQYALQAQEAGVGGWITFGSGVEDDKNFTARFVGPAASLLLPRVARAYEPLPVTNIGKLHAAGSMTGIVRLLAEDPVRITRQTVTIDGEPIEAAVIGLVQPGGDAAGLAGAETSIFQQLAGPCGGRPESVSCGLPVPIEQINSVAPDCDGNITIEFTGCATLGEIASQCGAVLDCALGMIDVCLDPHLPDNTGKLPNEYPDLFPPLEESEESPGSDISESLSQSVSTMPGTLPYLECFDDQALANWTVDGDFVFVSTENTSDECSDVSESLSDFVPDYYSYATEGPDALVKRNVAAWSGFDDTTLGRVTSADIMLKAGPAGARHNGGIVVNRRAHPTLPGRFVYFVVEIDYDEKQFRIQRFNGTNMIPQSAFVNLAGLMRDTWYRIVVTVEAGSGSSVDISATLSSVSGTPLNASLGPLNTNKFLPGNGDMGLHAYRAKTRFSWFKVEES